MWEQITAMVAEEFSDLPDASEATRIVLRLALAALLGGLLGIEREAKGKAAGVRTHMMVAMGAAMFVLASLQFDIQPAVMASLPLITALFERDTTEPRRLRSPHDRERGPH
jgi:putative Mg2+ transporter-C (MgtC) family protein